MRKAGTESWRFAHDIDESLHCVLYLRDVLGLQIEETESFRLGSPATSPTAPKCLARRPQWSPPHGGHRGGAPWSTKWHRHSWGLRPNKTGYRTGFARSQPGTVRSSILRSGLRLKAARRFVMPPAGCGSNPADGSVPPGSPTSRPLLDVFAWDQVRDAAERAADENEVSPGEVNGCAQVLLVEGSWWHIVAPGVALCSIAAARDPAIAPAILKVAFDSYLAG